MRLPTAAVSMLVGALGVAGCTIEATEVNPPRAVIVSSIPDAPSLRIGDRVRVHMHRDALGVAGTAAISLDPDGRDRADFWLEGTVVTNRPSWLTLDLDDGRRVMAAIDTILFIELLNPPATQPAP